MARSVSYKQYSRQQRRAVLESDFSKGMMSTDGVIDEGYIKSLVNFTFEKETSTLVPRPGVCVSGMILPDMLVEDPSEYLDSNVGIKDSKDCVEDNVTYHQIVLGRLDDNSNTVGNIWITTSLQDTELSEIEYSEDFTNTLSYSEARNTAESHKCYFYSVESPSIHNIYLTEDDNRRIEFPVGTFAFGNSYYFFGEDSNQNVGLYRTVFDAERNPAKYVFAPVEPKNVTVSEAVTYGYNMLKGDDAYSFNNMHLSPQLQLSGILPYDPATGMLLVTPKRNQRVDFRCYYDVLNGNTYDIIWEWRETTSSEWTLLHQELGWISGDDAVIEADFIPPAVDMMIRVSAYPYDNGVVSDTVEKAMTVGFDFTAENFGSANSMDQKVYSLHTATGMSSWKGRIVLWGVREDPTILFISDYNEPSYFPYPNNITVFDEPIIYAIEFMDNLAVFTTDKLYLVTLNSDGNSWTSTVLQSHLNINKWDKHLIQTVRNMLYFKSGNYYYMIVPKAQSTTGELTIAPITTPITSFFDNFSANVQLLLRSTYGYSGEYDLFTYYNFLDYEDIHNIYAFKFSEGVSVLHFDMIYNTVDRTWKVWIFEAPNLIYPYKHDSTKSGILATTSIIDCCDIDNPEGSIFKRIIQFYKWEKQTVRGCYLPDATKLLYNPDGIVAYVSNSVLYLPMGQVTIINENMDITGSLIFSINEEDVHIQGLKDYFSGFSIYDVNNAVRDVYNTDSEFFTFRNYQFLDSGYRDDELQSKKRYREIQFQVNNLDKKNIQFGMEYILDGSPRKIFYKYDSTQIIDEFDPEYGVIYIDSTPYLEVDLDDIDLTNQWTIDQELIPDITLWKVRVAVSGKGSAPRLKLYSRNEKRFELMGINWISKLMNMR